MIPQSKGKLRENCQLRVARLYKQALGTRTEEAGTYPTARGRGTEGVGKEAVLSAG